jgi:hypothetical protein
VNYELIGSKLKLNWKLTKSELKLNTKLGTWMNFMALASMTIPYLSTI